MIKRKIKNKTLAGLLEWFVLFTMFFLLYQVLHNYVIRIFNVNGSSMEPTLINEQKIAVSKLPYIFSEPKYRDIVTFSDPRDKSRDLVKRIIGVPGDTIDFNFEGLCFFRNGSPLEDKFSIEPVMMLADDIFPMTIPDGYYFVLGDNRSSSDDSRLKGIGLIARDDFYGKAEFSIWPFSTIE